MRVSRGVFALIAVFVAAVVAEHVIDSGLNPARHEISEYANGRHGWVIEVGFVAWSLSFALTAVAARRSGWLRLRRTIAALMAVACIGLAVVAAFATQTSAGVLAPGTHLDTGGRLHDAGSGAATLAIFVATGLSAIGVVRLRRLAVGLLVAAVVLDLGLLAIGTEVGGLRQRLLVAIGCVWQAMFAHQLGAPAAATAPLPTSVKQPS